MSLSILFTDLYELTMSAGYWELGKANQQAVFHLYFRNNPFRGNYTVASGLNQVIDFLVNFKVTDEDINYLRNLKAANNQPIFQPTFLNYLRNLNFSCDIDALPEGTVTFPNEPLLRIKGPLLECQLLESALLNFINFPSLIATKAARICYAAQGDAVFEFGLRRAQGIDGALTASRAAYIGGCVATSNTLAGKLFDIPVKGTHGHSWVMAFADELSAFKHYAKVMPHNAVFLVDTYHTLQGIKHAIAIGHDLRQNGFELIGIRLDSGDLNLLSKQARQLLNEAGFAHTKIMASNNLNEYLIASLKQQGAPIDLWGVGTHLSTAYDQPALDGVYKLSALGDTGGTWQYKVKISDEAKKTTTPGTHQVRRYYKQKQFISDVIYDVELGIDNELPQDTDRYQDLLVPIFRSGKLVYQPPSIHEIRKFCLEQVNCFMQSSVNEYKVSLENHLQKLKNDMLME